ncbi:hypothetical protein PISMIDRAFT_12859 [Pisolithus microcarpus 441]|uniref:Uncharacterized protein n=1 Tax=Pisolithus microcarpus 441 TaxID=765257 RepID=A0A0C9YV12_9AGAM|nr:hypothetical protein PISMIDRAFT_12859 [Pisolithus microcarpus 441]
MKDPLEPVPDILEEHYNVGKSQHRPIDLADFIRKNSGDPALQEFTLRLKRHLLPCIRAMHVLASEPSALQLLEGLDTSYDASEATVNHLLIRSNCIYQHCVLQVNYTTYDV